MKTKAIIARMVTAALTLGLLMPAMAQATTGLTSRSATVTDSTGSAGNVTYTVGFKAGTAGAVGSVMFEICDSPLESVPCAASASSGIASNGASLASGSMTGVFAGTNWSTPTWTMGAQTGPGTSGTSVKFAGNTTTTVATSDLATVTLTHVVNPTGNNQEYYLRTTVYGTTTYTSEVDYGAVALDTTQAMVVSGTMPESLVFCVGQTVSSDCSAIGGAAVALGTFSPTSSNAATSQMAASTNAGSGYIITVNGNTLTNGGNTIAAMGTQSANSGGCSPTCTSTTGASQFGTNTVANNVVSAGGIFGANVTPTGAGYGGAAAGGYATANSFRFFTGDTVASSATVSNAQTFENSYLANVAGSQAAGLYSATLTYICTATF